MTYRVHTAESAPPAARATLEEITKAWGFLPHLGAVLAESPAALDLLWVAYGALTGKATLTPAEQQLVSVVASRENRCGYCVAAHSTMALGADLPAAALAASRDGATIADPKLDALRRVAERLVHARGWLTDEEKQAFFRAGYTAGQLLEVVGWVAVKTLTNYVNHVAETPVDAQWQGQTWSAPAR
jgi:uncharacterized peroxidase-related enzyme